MQVPKEVEEKIQQVQMLEQNLANVRSQKQQIQTQILELESALEELEKTNEAYKIVGTIMVLSKKEELVKDLSAKKDHASLHLKKVVEQEEKLKEKMQTLQKEIMSKIKKEGE